uniref:VWFC domain-containing protein n=1 Tax=Oncorhynchus mykiss TaxID=8022 RepID=A0A8C7WEK2_ONCMY
MILVCLCDLHLFLYCQASCPNKSNFCLSDQWLISNYEFGDYRGKWCLDDHGFVYSIGEVYYPSPSACPCTCTEDGPVCIRPKCPRIHPRCTRIKYKSCCPVCEAVSKVCVYGGVSNLLFQLSRCERCRCESNREVSCSISDCPAPHCVNPTFEPNHCCPVCYTGEFTSTNTQLSNTINAWSYVTQAFFCTCYNICVCDQ